MCACAWVSVHVRVYVCVCVCVCVRERAFVHVQWVSVSARNGVYVAQATGMVRGALLARPSIHLCVACTMVPLLPLPACAAQKALEQSVDGCRQVLRSPVKGLSERLLCGTSREGKEGNHGASSMRVYGWACKQRAQRVLGARGCTPSRASVAVAHAAAFVSLAFVSLLFLLLLLLSLL